jgi:hypothetical protein
MGTVCDAGYTSIALDEHKIKIQDNGATILSGSRHSDTGMWHINLPMPNVKVANVIGEPKYLSSLHLRAVRSSHRHCRH